MHEEEDLAHSSAWSMVAEVLLNSAAGPGKYLTLLMCWSLRAQNVTRSIPVMAAVNFDTASSS